ncbi:hypothetical protein [Curtobacterium sp. VKM Ac-1395]|uniref:hypothetical protein n=1 Tax=Curtobacterium sp. VKM Ac-1395 TaxID=2783815 RepID=UPI00188D45EC|nr:hypothetical protein [Curtobacterium sp. VKM Ac-1395]MBF4591607.1 hypothetical protein [Curtobacterium sp. VKM Ac-1395]
MAAALLDYQSAVPRHLVMQPAGDAAKVNLQKTVLTPVPRHVWSEHLSDQDRGVLDREHPSGSVPMWGTTTGAKGQMQGKWDRMLPGDLVLFLANNRAFLAATVTHKWASESLADVLWPRKRSGAHLVPWQLMFSFTRPTPVRISYSEMATAAGVNGALGTREFNVYGAPISERVAALLNVDQRALLRTHPSIDFDEVVRTFDVVDAAASSARRLEQSYLRDLILPGRQGRCDLCSREMASVFLVAAHIKKRSWCSFEEKTDLPAIAMAACRFGCDEFFERGLIWISGTGSIRRSPALTDETARSYWTEHLQGKKVWRWEDRTASHKYFAVHREAHRP